MNGEFDLQHVVKRDTPPGAIRGGGVHCCSSALERANFADRTGASPGDCPLQGCLGYGVSRRPGADRFRRDLGVAPHSFGLRPCGRLVRESDRLHAKLWRLVRRCRAQCRRVFQSQESCWRFALLGGLRALKEFNALRRVSSVVLVESHPVMLLLVIPSLPLVLSLHRHVSSVLMLHCMRIYTRIIHMRACTRIHLRVPCMVCMMHVLC